MSKLFNRRIFKTLRRHYFTAAVLLMAVGFVCAAVGSRNENAVTVSAQVRKLPIYSVEREDGKFVSLTFDAAWGNDNTQALLETLSAHDVRATFFVIGQWAEKYPETVKLITDYGCEVMNHSDDHAHFAHLSSEGIMRNITAANDKITAITGVTPTLFRPPFGEYTNTVIDTLSDMGMKTIQWSVDSLDWKDISADEIYDRVVNKVSPGGIVLFHNAGLHTPEALGRIIEYLQDNGYTIVPVSELVLDGEYTIDNNGRQCKK